MSSKHVVKYNIDILHGHTPKCIQMQLFLCSRTQLRRLPSCLVVRYLTSSYMFKVVVSNRVGAVSVLAPQILCSLDVIWVPEVAYPSPSYQRGGDCPGFTSPSPAPAHCPSGHLPASSANIDIPTGHPVVRYRCSSACLSLLSVCPLSVCPWCVCLPRLPAQPLPCLSGFRVACWSSHAHVGAWVCAPGLRLDGRDIPNA